MTHLPILHHGQCRSCMKRTRVAAISRQGGGSYNRRPRNYRTSICIDCAVSMMPHAGVHAGAKHGGFPVRSLAEIARYDDEGARLVADWEKRRDENKARIERARETGTWQ